MISLYRISALFLLVGGISSLLALAASLVDQLKQPFFGLSILCSICLGIAGTVIYYRKPDNKDWIFELMFIIGLGMALLIGGVIQWVTQ